LATDEFIHKIFATMNDLPQHTFQILTKRPERAATWEGPWTNNIWLGTSVESEKHKSRIEEIKKCDAIKKFISFEPLLASVGKLNLSGIDWVIVGGESGQKFRKMNLDWAREIRNQCLEQKVAFFYKQESARYPGTGAKLDGEIWHQYPD
jgi:protein gp37